jgi:hypothetical protein
VVRKLAVVIASLLFATVVGLELGAANAYAAAGKKVDCDKVMSELGAGKKAKDAAADLKISTSSVYRCKKKAAQAAKATAAKSGAMAAPASAASPAK